MTTSNKKPSEFWLRLAGTALSQKIDPLNPNSLATFLGTSQGTTYPWYTGKGRPSDQLYERLAQAGETTVQYLRYGHLGTSADPLIQELLSIAEQVSPDARERMLRNARGELLQKQAESQQTNKRIATQPPKRTTEHKKPTGLVVTKRPRRNRA